jgi:hypothetical protein
MDQVTQLQAELKAAKAGLDTTKQSQDPEPEEDPEEKEDTDDTGNQK